MIISGENNNHVPDGYGKEMALSSDVKDMDKDKDEDESNNSIARSFDKPSAENLESKSDCNIVNATTELNYDEHIKPSVNVIEASYLTYSNAEGMFWTNWMLLIKVHSQHPKNRHHQQQLIYLH